VRVGVALFDGVEELDWAGPWEVLGMWSRRWPEDGIELVSVADDDRPVTCAKGIRVLPDLSWPTAGRLDVLIYPGGEGTQRQLGHGDPVHTRLTELADDGTLLASVCTGALVFAAAGLLRGRPATTHWRWLDRLRELDPTIDVRPDERFVDSGRIVTSAGVSAGIDMTLHLVSRLHSRERAAQVRRAIQYEPQPPV